VEAIILAAVLAVVVVRIGGRGEGGRGGGGRGEGMVVLNDATTTTTTTTSISGSWWKTRNGGIDVPSGIKTQLLVVICSCAIASSGQYLLEKQVSRGRRRRSRSNGNNRSM